MILQKIIKTQLKQSQKRQLQQAKFDKKSDQRSKQASKQAKRTSKANFTARDVNRKSNFAFSQLKKIELTVNDIKKQVTITR